MCDDCKATLDFTKDYYCLCEKPRKIQKPGKCRNCQNKNLDGLYFAFNYQIPLVKKLIFHFKYEPFVRELAEYLADLLKDYFLFLEEKPDLSDFLIIPLPLDKNRLKWRGYNQAEELAKYFCRNFNLEMRNDILFKAKKTKPQQGLGKSDRRDNVKGAFLVKDKEAIKNRKILLIDDVYTTGFTMEEAAKILKQQSEAGFSGAKEVWGLVVAREELNYDSNKRP